MTKVFFPGPDKNFELASYNVISGLLTVQFWKYVQSANTLQKHLQDCSFHLNDKSNVKIGPI